MTSLGTGSKGGGVTRKPTCCSFAYGFSIPFQPAAHHRSGDTTDWQPAISKESSGRVLPPGGAERLPCGNAGMV